MLDGLVVDLLVGEQAGLDPLGELDLLLGVQQRDLADLLQVVLDRVGGRAGGHDLLLGLVGVVGRGQGEALVLDRARPRARPPRPARTSTSSTSSRVRFLPTVTTTSSPSRSTSTSAGTSASRSTSRLSHVLRRRRRLGEVDASGRGSSTLSSSSPARRRPSCRRPALARPGRGLAGVFFGGRRRRALLRRRAGLSQTHGLFEGGVTQQPLRNRDLRARSAHRMSIGAPGRVFCHEAPQIGPEPVVRGQAVAVGITSRAAHSGNRTSSPEKLNLHQRRAGNRCAFSDRMRARGPSTTLTSHRRRTTAAEPGWVYRGRTPRP